jgi:hypothetical protein
MLTKQTKKKTSNDVGRPCARVRALIRFIRWRTIAFRSLTLASGFISCDLSATSIGLNLMHEEIAGLLYFFNIDSCCKSLHWSSFLSKKSIPNCLESSQYFAKDLLSQSAFGVIVSHHLESKSEVARIHSALE